MATKAVALEVIGGWEESGQHWESEIVPPNRGFFVKTR